MMATFLSARSPCSGSAKSLWKKKIVSATNTARTIAVSRVISPMASRIPATTSNTPVGSARFAGRLVAESISAVGVGSAIFCSPETMNMAASRTRPTIAAINDMALSPASARPAAPAINARRRDPCRSELGEGHAALAHVLAGAVGIADFARLVALKKQELAGAFVRIDLGGERRGVREFQRHVAFPFGLERGHVHDDAAAGISALAEADHQHVARDAEVLDRAGECERVGRDHADVGFAVDEAVGGEVLGVDHCAVDVGEDLELVGHPRVVAIARPAVGDAPLAALGLYERLDHAAAARLVANPAV